MEGNYGYRSILIYVNCFIRLYTAFSILGTGVFDVREMFYSIMFGIQKVLIYASL